MKNVEKTYRPKAGVENLTVDFPNALTGKTVTISEWPHRTQSSVEMSHLDAHPLVTDQAKPAERKANAKKEDS